MKMNRLPKREEGSIFVWSAVGLAVLIAFAGFATDIPYVYVARHQAQTAADAGAIAGAYGLLTGTASQDATAFARKTPIIGTLLTAPQIDAFACNSNGGTVPECTANSANPDQVTCITHRDVAHGNPMPLFVLPILQIFGLGRATATSSGWDAANVSATATARIFNTCSGDCFKPWSIPDKWNDVNGNGQFDDGVDLYDPATTGYQWPRDTGTLVTLKVGNPGNKPLIPSFFYGVDFPPLNRGNPVPGGSVYRDNIATCGNGSFVAVGDQLQQEPGAKIGPTRHGVEALIALDPTAFWNMGCNCLNSPKGVTSPRLIRIAFFDPQAHVSSGRSDITVTNVGGFFLEGMQGNDVVGYYTQVVASGGSVDPACAGLQTVQLVK
jgi:hypothetical protein